jgi:hypothetical protein
MIGDQQRAASQFVTFTAIAKMNTKLAREALPESDAAWVENLQIIGQNNLVPVPAPLAGLATLLGGRTTQSMFFANVGAVEATTGTPAVPPVDYIIVFTTSGAGIAVRTDTGVQTLFAPDNTFTNPDMTSFASQRILIADPKAGYSQWDGTVFTTSGGVSPNIQVTNGGNYAVTPTVAITGGSGSGVTATAVMGGSALSAWNPNDLSGGIVLSNGYLTATATAVGGVRGTSSYSSGKYYYEYELRSIVSNIIGCGVCLGTSSLTNSSNPGSAFVSRTGAITINSATSSSAIPAQPELTIVAVAVDLTAKLIWFRISPSGQWNGSSTANPGTGVGGLDISAIVTGPMFPVCFLGANLDVVIANFGSNAFSGAVPTGFGAWNTNDGAGLFVSKVQLTNSGINYKAGDVLTVTFTPAGATATAMIWPKTDCMTIAVFAGRVWTGNHRILAWTGINGYDDTNPANGAGSTVISDADLNHQITALRSLNNYLFIFGDHSVRSIGQIALSGSITLFTPLVLSSDIGTTFPRTIMSYNRLVLFANKIGVFAIFGSSVEKISDDMDGIFGGGSQGGTVHSNIDFAQPLCAAVQDLRNIHCYLLLVKYFDPTLTPPAARGLILVFQEKIWTVTSSNPGVLAMCPTFTQQYQQWDTFVSAGPDVTQILQDPNTAVPIKLVTSLTSHGNPIQAKQPITAGVGLITTGTLQLQMCIDSEYFSRCYALAVGQFYQWINNKAQLFVFTNSTGGAIYFTPSASVAFGYNFPYIAVDGNGKFLGMTITATISNAVLNMAAIEYQPTKLWGVPQL